MSERLTIFLPRKGAGAGGIAIAARLAKAGIKVTVLEKNNFTGGRCSLIFTENGFRFDQGPSLFLLPVLFKETFNDLDTSLDKAGIELLRCPINYDIWFADGGKARTSTDESIMKQEIERFEGKDGFKRYLQWKAEAHDHYETSLKFVLRKNFTSFFQLAAPRFVWYGLGLHPLESIWSRTTRYFYSNRLRMVFTFATMYMGMSPFDAPSTYSLLQYTELAEGIWYPKGGFQKVLQAIVDIGKACGVKYRLEAPVKKILVSDDGTTARGVELESGETLDADLVVINSDLVYAYSNLFPQTEDISEYSKALRAKDTSCSSISFYWSVSKKVKELNTHNIFLANDYRDSFDSIFKKQTIPDEPSFYINVPSRIDPTAAPEGMDAVIALVPVGHLMKSAGTDDKPGPGFHQDGRDMEALIKTARESVLSNLAKRTGSERLDKYIIGEIVNTPWTWQEKFNLDKGAILGLSHNFTNVLAFRPPTRARGLKNTYFVGASTHPGTGVPVVLAGAKITAEQILKDHGMDIPWNGKLPAVRDQGVQQDKMTDELDKRHPALWASDSRVMLGMIIAILVLAILIEWCG